MAKTFVYKKDFGDLIRKERTEKELSMKELASKVGVSEQAVSQWERGIRRLSFEMGSELAKALGTSTIDILNKYKRRNEFLSELGWDENNWKVLFQSPYSTSRQIESSKDALVILVEKLGYHVFEKSNGDYSVKFPDGYKLQIKSAELNAVTDKSADYINMLFTQFRHDHKKE